jgi:hypothetical protein
MMKRPAPKMTNVSTAKKYATPPKVKRPAAPKPKVKK